MPRFTPLSGPFNAGELSPRLHARTDFQKYANGAETVENLIPLAEGGLMRRPGTRYVAEVADSTVAGRLKRFQFSDDESHVLEFGDMTLRFFLRQGQQVVPDTTATITNGTFDSATTGWTDESTGGTAAIGHEILNQEEEGTFDLANVNIDTFGDGVANSLNLGLRFPNSLAGDISRVRIDVSAVGTSFNAVAAIYTDSAGSPGAQVGIDSDTLNLNSTGEKAFTWAGGGPTLSADTTYWVVLTDDDAGTGNVTIRTGAGQGTNFGSGNHDTITSITDSLSREHRIGVTVDVATANGALALIGDANQTAIAQQAPTVDADTEHCLALRVRGVPGDYIDLRIGTGSGDVDLIDDLRLFTGWHLVSFTPEDTTVYIQFRNPRDKTVHVDDVSFLDDEALSITTPYVEADLPFIMTAQSADVMYLLHEDQTMKLERRALLSWSLSYVPFQDGPYLDANADSDKTLTMAAATGFAVSCTATDHAPFASADVGRLIRITSNTDSTEWGWGIIVEHVAADTVKVDIQRTMPTGARADWRLGAWSDTTGWPTAAAFFEQRLYAAATDEQPQTLWASQTADFENMRPDSFESSANETQDDDAFPYTLSADDVQKIQWLSPGEDTLVIGAHGGEWLPSSEGETITPLDITIRLQTSHGSAPISPVRIGQVVLFIQHAERKLREFAFRFETDGFVGADMTRLAQHITRGGMVEMAYQQEPDSLAWVVRGDGTLLSMTYRREEDVVAWARHIIGGSFSSGNAVVDSVTTIAGFDDSGQVQNSGDRDEVWMIVKRTINSATKRYVEFFEGDFETGDDVDDAYYVDSCITYDAGSTSTITGISHLEAETAKVWGNGFPLDDATVSSGQITTSAAVTTAQIGLGFTHKYKGLKVEGGNPAGTAVTRHKRLVDLGVVLLNCHRVKIQIDDGPVRTETFRTSGSDALYTGETEPLGLEAGWKRDTRIIIEDDAPAPFTLLAFVPHYAENPIK